MILLSSEIFNKDFCTYSPDSPSDWKKTNQKTDGRSLSCPCSKVLSVY